VPVVLLYWSSLIVFGFCINKSNHGVTCTLTTLSSRFHVSVKARTYLLPQDYYGFPIAEPKHKECGPC
jgi:hypothetical protein